jgi:hypothetical protein
MMFGSKRIRALQGELAQMAVEREVIAATAQEAVNTAAGKLRVAEDALACERNRSETLEGLLAEAMAAAVELAPADEAMSETEVAAAVAVAAAVESRSGARVLVERGLLKTLAEAVLSRS